MMDKRAETDHPILEVIEERWSARAMSADPVDTETLASLLEAARWAASCFNEQPWAYVVVRRDDPGFADAVECLTEKNRLWAQRAGAILFACARRSFSANGKPNRWASHDVGQANAHMALQAASMGLVLHQMGGFSADRVRETYRVPDDWEPLTAIAIGHPGRPQDLEEGLRAREVQPRSRKSQREFSFFGTWGGEAPITPG